MKLVKTDDGSFTAFNEEIKEHYHSTTGALEEAFEKHIKPLNVLDGMKILDFCFGLGYNSFVAFYQHHSIEITGLEIDIEIVNLISKLKIDGDIAKVFEYFSQIGEKKQMTDKNGNSLNLIMGDAKEKIKCLPKNYFDLVFFDPFSPQKHPEMWTEKVFEDVYKCLKKKGKLSTYSCSKRIRRNLEAVGFSVYDGPCVGRRSPSTIAIKEK